MDDELCARLAAEGRSKVTFDIEEQGPMVKLTVVHDDFDPGSIVAERVSGGWPRVMSDLKSLLETGVTLDAGSNISIATGRDHAPA
jgi:hypothetical protein